MANIHWGLLDEAVVRHNTREPPVEQIKPVTSAGILPFAVYKRRVFFLLGREGYEPQYGESDKWSDFSGKLDAGETVEEGAAREFYQETAGCILEMAEALQRLRDNQFLLQCDLHPENRNSSSFRTYLMLVPYRDYPAIFRRTKHFLQYVGADIGCIEKTQLNWFSYREMQDIVFDRWGADRYRRKPKFRAKFAESMRRIFRDTNLYDECLAAYALVK
jgi:8-oxo-dGTP pyrophosphatase MutT (NUDIX family)